MIGAPVRPSLTLAAAEDAEAASLPRLLACASQGSGGDDETRLRVLLSHFETIFIPFARNEKLKSFRRCFHSLRFTEHDLFVLEGTGIGAGLAAVLGALLFGRRFVVSSGDAVGPFLSARFPIGSPVFHLYERLLYRASSGFIGWTPYLVGRALTLGARQAVTCPGWSPCENDPCLLQQARSRIRADFGIAEDAVVFGMAGSLIWSKRFQYCYGLELVRALRQSCSKAVVLVVGDGSGLQFLKEAAGEELGKSIFLTGRVAREQVAGYLSAMDIGSLPQTVDGVGSFRYTTKISEYRALGLSFITNEIPAAYDLDRGDIWRLPGKSPWDGRFIDSLSALMKTITPDDLPPRGFGRKVDGEFDREAQVRRVTSFLKDLASAARKQPEARRGNA